MIHTVIEAEKSHHFQSASWKPRRDNGTSSSPKAREDQGLSLTTVTQTANPPLLYLFILFRSSAGGMSLTCMGEGTLLYSAYLFKCHQNNIQKQPHRHTKHVYPNIWVPRGPVKLTHKISHQYVLKLISVNFKKKLIFLIACIMQLILHNMSEFRMA